MSEENGEVHHPDWSRLSILRAIANGHDREKRIRNTLRMATSDLRQQLEELESEGFIEQEGTIVRRWRLTPSGVNALYTYGYTQEIHSTRSNVHTQEIRHTTTFGSGFKLVLGALMAFLVFWAIIGVFSALLYWVIYHLLCKQYIPQFLQSYIPFDNILIDLILGFVTATIVIAPLRKRMSPTSILGR